MAKGMHKIVFVTLSNIGDAVLTLPVLSALKDNFPYAVIDVVVGPRPEKIFTKDPRVRNIFVYNKHTGIKNKISFVNRLRKERYDLCVDLRSSLIPFLIGAKNSTSPIDVKQKGIVHKRVKHLNKLKKLGIEYKDCRNIYIDDADRKKIEELLHMNAVSKEDLLIGVSPSCLSPLKEWGISGFTEVIRSMLSKDKRKVVLIGDNTQKKRSGMISDSVANSNLIDLTGAIDLNELFALVEKMDLLLTGDSAPMHIASDLGVKVVALFGPTDPREYGPFSKDSLVIRKEDLECSPCKKAQCKFNTHDCMRLIEAGEVIEAMEKVLHSN